MRSLNLTLLALTLVCLDAVASVSIERAWNSATDLHIPTALKCADPNGTATKFYWESCGPNLEVQPTWITVTDDAGKTDYPLDLSKPLVITADSYNNGGTYTKQTVDVELYQWGGWLGCSWHPLPTFGLLSGLDGCKFSLGNCPMKRGQITLTEKVDLTQFAQILGALIDNTPYKINVKIKNGGDSEHELISCITVEGRVTK